MNMNKAKNLPLAIGLNILLPGLGYIYYGKWIVGLAGGALVIAIAASNPARNALMVWLMMNAIMLIDMLMLHSRMKKKFAAANLIKCPSCAESIMKEAKKCRFCGESLKEAA